MVALSSCSFFFWPPPSLAFPLAFALAFGENLAFALAFGENLAFALVFGENLAFGLAFAFLVGGLALSLALAGDSFPGWSFTGSPSAVNASGAGLGWLSSASFAFSSFFAAGFFAGAIASPKSQANTKKKQKMAMCLQGTMFFFLCDCTYSFLV